MANPSELVPAIREQLEINGKGIPELLAACRDADVAELLNDMTRPEAAAVFEQLDDKRAIAVADQADLHRRGAMFAELDPNRAAAILEEMSADQRTDVFREMSLHDRGRILPKLTPPARAEAEALLAYPVDTCGGVMTTEYVKLEPTMTVDDALKHVRGVARDRESIYACYVLDGDGKLVGALSLRDLVMAEGRKTIADVMRRNPIKVQVNEPRLEASRKISKYNLLAVPVLDNDGRLAGFITVDDVIDVMIEVQTDQMLQIGGVEAGALDDPYLDTPFLTLVRKRARWLIVLFLGEMLTATAMGFFEKEIEKAVVLALFVPLIISSGGNSGSQAASLLIRALALREVRLGDWWRVFRRELTSGLLLGTLLGAIGFLRIALWRAIMHDYCGDHWVLVGLTVACSLMGIVTWGTISGSMLPFILKKCGADPATSSAPFVATLVDVTGLVIYFSAAMVILRGTLL